MATVISLSNQKGGKIKQYFPPSYTPQQIGAVIIKLLKNWHKRYHAIFLKKW